MKYAMVDGQRRGALPGLAGKCPKCDAAMTPKCGRFRVAHWAHPPGSFEHQWEPETEWHRSWKECFPGEWQELVHQASNGERHIADVKTGHGLVIEFQHSDISEEERRSREAIYRPMCWVIDGLKLKRDIRRFIEALRSGRRLITSPLILIAPTEKCILLRKWADSRVHVFFDFGGPVLWASLPRKPDGFAVLMPIPRNKFVEDMIKGEPINFPKVTRRTRQPSVPQFTPSPPHPWKPRPLTFEQYMARKRRARARIRF